MNKIRLILGDWSGDGHGKSEDIYVECNLDKDNLAKAFDAGVKKLEVDISDCCSDYEDSSIPRDIYQIIAAVDPKWTKKLLGEEEPENEYDYVEYKTFATLWMLTAQAGNPDLKWDFCEDSPYIAIGGYGLFGS